MKDRLRTSSRTAEILKDLQNSTRLNPNILARLSIALSLRNPDCVESFKSASNGLEFNRFTLTGNQDVVYKCLVAEHYGHHISDDKYFELVKLHLDRGAIILANEYKYGNNYERTIINLLRTATEDAV